MTLFFFLQITFQLILTNQLFALCKVGPIIVLNVAVLVKSILSSSLVKQMVAFFSDAVGLGVKKKLFIYSLIFHIYLFMLFIYLILIYLFIYLFILFIYLMHTYLFIYLLIYVIRLSYSYLSIYLFYSFILFILTYLFIYLFTYLCY